MKKSTLLFITGNILVLLMPIVLMLGLRFKINRGEVIDLRAEYEAKTKKERLGLIENIVLTGQEKAVNLSIYMDTTNRISIDTGDYRYLSYKLIGNTLFINHDFKRDSTENFDPEQEEGTEEKYTTRELRLFLNTNLKKMTLKGGIATLHLSPLMPQKSDLTLDVKDGSFYIERGSREGEQDEMGYRIDYAFTDSIPNKVKANLNNARLGLEISYIRQLDIEARYSEVDDDGINFDQYNLKLDDYSNTEVEIGKLKRMNITYLK